MYTTARDGLSAAVKINPNLSSLPQAFTELAPLNNGESTHRLLLPMELSLLLRELSCAAEPLRTLHISTCTRTWSRMEPHILFRRYSMVRRIAVPTTAET